MTENYFDQQRAGSVIIDQSRREKAGSTVNDQSHVNKSRYYELGL